MICPITTVVRSQSFSAAVSDHLNWVSSCSTLHSPCPRFIQRNCNKCFVLLKNICLLSINEWHPWLFVQLETQEDREAFGQSFNDKKNILWRQLYRVPKADVQHNRMKTLKARIEYFEGNFEGKCRWKTVSTILSSKHDIILVLTCCLVFSASLGEPSISQ